MRIAFVGPFGMAPKATTRARALPLAQALAHRDHQVALFVPPFHTPEAGGKVWLEGSVTVECVPLSRWPLLVGYAITTWRLVRRTLAWRPEVVHCFKPKGYSGLAQWLLWRRRWLGGQGPRLVLDSDDWEGWGGWNELEPYPAWQKRLFAWQERWGLTHADAVTVASRALETLVWSLGVPPDRVVYLPNGVSGVAPLSTRPPLAGPPIVLLYTRFFEFDVRRVVQLLAQVRERVPEARLLVVGKGLYGEEAQLLTEAAAAGLTEAVQYVGWAEREALPDYFAAAHCAIYPFDDTLVNRTKCPVKLLDLLAAGVPVVGEAVGQIRETIEPGRSGLLVPPGQDDALAAAVVDLLENPALRDRLSEGARERVAAGLTWEGLAERVEHVYRN